MKKLRILLILCLTLAVTLPAASANSWNLNGQLLAMVEQTHDYDEYTGLVSDYNRKAATTHTILTSRYHNQLIAVDEVKDGWKDAIFSTTAVYQPSELDETGYPKITRTKSGFELAYPDIDERYYFELSHNNEGENLLHADGSADGRCEGGADSILRLSGDAGRGQRHVDDQNHAGRLQHPQHAETRAG